MSECDTLRGDGGMQSTSIAIKHIYAIYDPITIYIIANSPARWRCSYLSYLILRIYPFTFGPYPGFIPDVLVNIFTSWHHNNLTTQSKAGHRQFARTSHDVASACYNQWSSEPVLWYTWGPTGRHISLTLTLHNAYRQHCVVMYDGDGGTQIGTIIIW
jgi:hypothetical protein